MQKELKNKLITCILPKGKALPVIKVLKDHGITRCNFAFARGSDIGDPEWKKGLPREVEKEILTVVARDEEQGEEIFDLVFTTAELNKAGGGFMYMTKLAYAIPYILPEIDEEGNQVAIGVQGPGKAVANSQNETTEVSASSTLSL